MIMAESNFVQKALRLTMLTLGVIAIAACGDSLSRLDGLAAAGAIHEDAPVTTHLQIRIAASPAKVWALLIDASEWPKWNREIESVSATGVLGFGSRFSWKTGGATIHSQVQLFDPEHRLAWTGTALTAKAIHVWELTLEPGNQTLVSMKESMDGPLMAAIYPSQKLAASDTEWLTVLKRAAESTQ